jgi:hypothetical protein
VSSLRGEIAAGSDAASWRLVGAGAYRSRPWRFHPIAVLRLAIFLLLVAQLGRIPFLSTGTTDAPILFNDFCVMVVLAVGALAAVQARSFRIDAVAGIGLIFCAVGASSAVLAVPRFGLTPAQLVVSVAYLARWTVYFGLYLVVINVVRSDEVTRIWGALETMILVFAAFGIVQAVFLPHFAQLVYPDSVVYRDWDEQGHRLVSTVLDPNIAGAMLMLVLLVELSQLAEGERVPLWKPVVLFAAQVATLSRGALLSLVVGTVVVLAIRGVSRRVLRFAVILGLAGLAALPKIITFARAYNKLEIDASALGRVANWLRALAVWRDHPFFGIGFNTYGFVSERYGGVRVGTTTYSVDGGLLFIAVMTGLVGLLLYSGMLYLVMRHCRRIWRDPSAPAASRALATGIAAGTVAICVNSLFVNSLLTTFVMEELWILWGLAFVMYRATVATGPAEADIRVLALRQAR